jgi:uncharacterized Rossmann fold enzyme
MKPLEITVQAAGSEEELCSNIRSALARGLPEFQYSPVIHDGTFVCVGSGWSMPDHIEAIKAHRDAGHTIVAIKAAHDFLVENGVEPDLYVNLDPRDRRSGVQRLNDRTTYLIASRCSPDMFDHVAGRKVMLWHAYSSDEQNAIGKRLLVGGGTTSGLRAINIGYLLGFKKFELYGYDSCNREDGTKRFTGELTGKTIDVFVGGPFGKRFICNMAMAAQANEFQKLFDIMPDALITAHGPGLIAEIMRQRLPEAA